MKTIEAFEKEIEMQKNFLQRFVPQKTLSEQKVRKAIFCGAGDSFAVAQLAEVFSGFRARVFDPLDLLKNKELSKDRDLYLISISGNTIANVKLARAKKNSTAITANPQSKLAKTCKKSIILKYPSSGIFTSGSISFLSAVMTCISLVSKPRMRDVPCLYERAKNQARAVTLRGKIFVLGNLHTYPVAMYAAAKLYETIGADAYYERIEEFAHMELFSATKGDTVIIFEEKNNHTALLEKNLKSCGLKVFLFDPLTKSILDQVLFFIFLSQFIALFQAKNKKDCFFVEAKKLRSASSSMIY